MSNRNYIIGSTIRFSPSTESLCLTENPDISILLTPSCSRLLGYLISNQGIVVSRDSIFTILWSQYGSAPSNSSLNTYISLIRKAFVNLGMTNEVITTIPKTGFLLNPDINIQETEFATDIECNSASTVEVNHHINHDAQLNTDSNIDLDEEKKEIMEMNGNVPVNIRNGVGGASQEKKKNTSIFFVITVLLIVGIVTAVCIQETLEAVPPVTPVNLGKIDTCDILFLPVHPGDSLMSPRDDIRFIIKKSGFTCKTGGVFYVYADKRFMISGQGKTFVSYCELREKSVKNCTSYIGDNLKHPVVSMH